MTTFTKIKSQERKRKILSCCGLYHDEEEYLKEKKSNGIPFVLLNILPQTAFQSFQSSIFKTTISSLENLKVVSLFEEAYLSLESVLFLLISCKKLEYLDATVTNCDSNAWDLINRQEKLVLKLKHLHLREVWGTNGSFGLDRIIDVSPQLKVLNLWFNIDFNSPEEKDFAFLARLPQGLEELDLTLVSCFGETIDASGVFLSPAIKTIKRIELGFGLKLNGNVLPFKAPHLESLSVEMKQEISPSIMTCLSESPLHSLMMQMRGDSQEQVFPISSLINFNANNISDDEVQAVVSRNPNLEQLVISNRNQTLTEVSLIHLKELKNLKQLVITQKSVFSSQSIISFLRNRSCKEFEFSVMCVQLTDELKAEAEEQVKKGNKIYFRDSSFSVIFPVEFINEQ